MTNNDGTPMDMERLTETMAEMDGDAMDFLLTRADPLAGQTFSKEGLETLTQAIRMFVWARVSHHWKEREAVGPSQLRFECRVTVDGVSATVPLDEHPWYRVDGMPRAQALGAPPEDIRGAVNEIAPALDRLSDAARRRVLRGAARQLGIETIRPKKARRRR